MKNFWLAIFVILYPYAASVAIVCAPASEGPEAGGCYQDICVAVCPNGYYCPSGSTAKILCPAGYYCPKTIFCDAGDFGGMAADQAIPCPDGTYSTGGAIECITCTKTPCDSTTGESTSDTDTVCDLGISKIKTSSGIEIPLYASKITSPAIHVKYNGGICYAKLAEGHQANTINLKYNNKTYHAVSEAEQIEYVFSIDVIDDASLEIVASGEFYFDCDGTKTTIIKDTVEKWSSPTCEAGKTLRIGGHASGYRPSNYAPTVKFVGRISNIQGCLGCIFSTLPDGSQPGFSDLFFYQDAVTSIPAELFRGITGTAGDYMFAYMFDDVPLGEIPSGLFDGITGANTGAFEGTFQWTNITKIPDDLFATLDTTMSLPQKLFAYTFYGCSNLSGESAKIGNRYLYEIWPDAGHHTYGNCTGLTDYKYIPTTWGGLGQ